MEDGITVTLNSWERRLLALLLEEYMAQHTQTSSSHSALRKALGDVQRRLGHATAQETLDTYSHLWPDDDEKTTQAVDSQLGAVLVRNERGIEGAGQASK